MEKFIESNSSERLPVPHARDRAKLTVKQQGARRALELALPLLQSKDRNQTMFGLYVLQHAYPESSIMAQEYLPLIADDPSWEVRETVAMVLRRLLEKDFDRWFAIIEKMGKSQIVNVQRAAIVGSMIKNPDRDQTQKIWNLYLPHFKSTHTYIKKNLGPFALADLARKQPEFTFDAMRSLAKDLDEMTRWNLLMAFSQRLGKTQPDIAREFLKMFANDDRVAVQRAVKSLRRKLGEI